MQTLQKYLNNAITPINKKNIEQMIMMLSRDIRLFIESVHEEAANMPAEGRPQKIKFQLLRGFKCVKPFLTFILFADFFHVIPEVSLFRFDLLF